MWLKSAQRLGRSFVFYRLLDCKYFPKSSYTINCLLFHRNSYLFLCSPFNGICDLRFADIAVLECLSTLRYKSLLDIDRGTDCYRFHRRVKVFFMSQIRREEQEQFSDQLAIYYRYNQASKLAVEHKPGSTSNSGKAIFSHTVPQKYTSLSGSYNALDIIQNPCRQP